MARLELLSLRTVAGLTNATERRTRDILAEPDPEQIKFRFLSYNGAYRILRRHYADSGRAVAELKKWRDDPSVKRRTSSFRDGAYSGLEWCAETVLPMISKIVEHLEGDRSRNSRPLPLEGDTFTGGFHILADWKDGSRRLVYFLGPRWPKRMVKAMLVLLQLKARVVYRIDPRLVIIVNIPRKELIELCQIDPEDEKTVRATARWLIEYVRGRRAG